MDLLDKNKISSLIKQKALDLGFSACGIAKAEPVSAEAIAEMEEWLAKGYAAGMDYMHKNKHLRYDPRELQPGAKSLIVVVMNYYPKEILQSDLTLAYYAYGKDYHFVLKNYLAYLFKYIEELVNGENYIENDGCDAEEIDDENLPFKLEGRAFTDSAPLMERYWAVKAGVGFKGRNSLIIVPGVGSFCFLGILAVNIELGYDSPLKISCGSCHRCEKACPTCAISAGMVDANRCISYHTIESKSEYIPEEISSLMGTRVYGCDECQLSCPWNKRFAHPTTFEEFAPTDFLSKLSLSAIEEMSARNFKKEFQETALHRISKKKFQNNIVSVKNGCIVSVKNNLLSQNL